MVRIGIAQVLQESNCFNPIATTRRDFELYGVASGAAVLKQYGEVGEIGGFLSGIHRWNGRTEPVGVLRAQAWPGGPLAPEARDWLAGTLRRELARAGRLDALLFSLHGSLAAKDDTDVDGTLLAEARSALGPGAPIVATLDLHAHCTPRMVELADVLVAYHTSPHVDIRETGQRAAATLRDLLDGAQPASSLLRLPMLSPSATQDTSSDALAPVYARLAGLEARRDILSAAVFMVQPWLDTAALGSSVLVTTAGDAPAARREAERLADMHWATRSKGTPGLLPPCECVARALACEGKPVVVADGADATNSGACGDSTHLLKALLAQPIPGNALTIVVDPQAVAHATCVGAGAPFAFPVGGKRDSVFSTPLLVRGRVVGLSPARYVLTGHGGSNLPVDMGSSAIVTTGDVTVLLVEHPGPGSTPMMYRCAGLEPTEFKVVVVKSPAGFRAEFGPFAAEILLADCPGCASPHYGQLPYRRVTGPLWPLDDLAEWRDAGWAGFAEQQRPPEESQR